MKMLERIYKGLCTYYVHTIGGRGGQPDVNRCKVGGKGVLFLFTSQDSKNVEKLSFFLEFGAFFLEF